MFTFADKKNPLNIYICTYNFWQIHTSLYSIYSWHHSQSMYQGRSGLIRRHGQNWSKGVPTLQVVLSSTHHKLFVATFIQTAQFWSFAELLAISWQILEFSCLYGSKNAMRGSWAQWEAPTSHVNPSLPDATLNRIGTGTFTPNVIFHYICDTYAHAHPIF